METTEMEDEDGTHQITVPATTGAAETDLTKANKEGELTVIPDEPHSL
ncbi:hypothetical protein A2U01_0041855 [Trifolium medium]|uniref:Uncharacterized protein n=1 Tax=Trifolium medium TaxID=97028 RepID=A0A392Q9Z2_9FABA|nr:hypothetical protein [Trifolium medium]